MRSLVKNQAYGGHFVCLGTVSMDSEKYKAFKSKKNDKSPQAPLAKKEVSE